MLAIIVRFVVEFWAAEATLCVKLFERAMNARVVDDEAIANISNDENKTFIID
jgi:hypothetical protein